ncbi:MAG: filamentous hemagglutinin N-terminal domain-containing protein [Elainellaceae cyanobacterium]
MANQVRLNPLFSLWLLPVLSLSGLLSLTSQKASAQITPDATLGAESSRIRAVNQMRDLVEGGAIRGGNLFHSFEDFNIGEGREAYFANPAGIANILSRVTGSNVSDILGTLGVDGTANLFFLNPNGIIFGPNARLDVNGSFVATTADAFQFVEFGEFSARSPEAPSLLMVNVPVGLQYGIQIPGTIISRGSRLFVEEGRSLILAGGEIQLNNSFLAIDFSEGGQIELGAIGGEGTVGLVQNGSLFNLEFPSNLIRSDISLANRTILDVLAENGGSIKINARNLNISNSELVAGIASGRGFAGARAGDIEIHASESVRLSGSNILNWVNTRATGNGGNIIITTRTFEMIGINRGISVSTFGKGDAGRIIIDARDQVFLDSSLVLNNLGTDAIGNTGGIELATGTLRLINGAQVSNSIFGREGDSGRIVVNTRGLTTLDGFNGTASSALFSNAGSNAGGDSGGIQISTGALSITNGAQVSAETRGSGNAGSIRIDARDQIYLDSSGSNGPSRIISTVRDFATGTAKGVEITANSLVLTRGAGIFGSTRGFGDAGSVSIRVENLVHLGGLSAQTGRFSGIFNTTEAIANGDGGTIDIHAQDIRLTGGAVISTATFGANDGGDITINADTLEAANGGEVLSSAFGAGRAGSVRLNISNNLILQGSNPIYFEVVELLGENFRNIIDNVGPASGVFAVSRNSGTGGNIIINTPRIIVQDGAEISAATGPEVSEELGAINNGFGRPGNISIRGADSIILSDNGSISTSVEPGANVTALTDDPGNQIEIQTRLLALSNDAQITSSTFGVGDAGRIFIRDAESVSLTTDSSISTAVNLGAVGQGGSISIQADSISLTDDAQISSSTDGQGDAGRVILRASRFTARRGGQVLTSTTSSNDAGSISLDISDRVLLSGDRTGLFASTESDSLGRGGSIDISTRQLDVQDQAQIAVNSQGLGQAGNLEIAANTVRLNRGNFTAETISSRGGAIGLQISELLSLDNESQISTSTQEGQGGRLEINVNRLPTNRIELSNSSRIATEAQGSGDAGDLGINVRQLFVQNSEISASTQSGVGGGIVLRGLDTLQVSDGEIFASTNTGRAGSLRIEAFDRIDLRGEGGLSVEAEGSGRAGSLTVQAEALRVREGASVSVSSQQGRAGNLTIGADTIQLDTGSLTAETRQSGANITLQDLDLLLMDNESGISAEAFGAARGSNVSINAIDGFVIAVPDQDSDIVANASRGRGGNIQIATQGIFGLVERPAIPGNGTNDIDASSQFGTDGVVVVDDLGIDPVQGVAELPIDTEAPPLSQGCQPGIDGQGRFINIEQGGIPTNPSDPISSSGGWEDIQPANAEENELPDSQLPDEIIEAEGWQVNEQGQVVLHANMTESSTVFDCQLQ